MVFNIVHIASNIVRKAVFFGYKGSCLCDFYITRKGMTLKKRLIVFPLYDCMVRK
ncbi:hypothetical protein GGR07_001880 [Bacteroides pyogenes]|nr:hypothetical protein [Bacteroides pyogenes]SUV34547.1 Uncharacterised protein [Bacteroides pyogenes]